MPKLTEEEIENIRTLRKGYMSIKNIAKKVGLSVGSVHLYVKDIKLPKKVQEDLNRTGFRNGISQLSGEKRSARNRKAGITRTANGDNQALLLGTYASGVVYRKDELPAKKVLEEIYKTDFHKEQIENVFFDFANDTYLIEYTNSLTHGPYRALRRFKVAISKADPRKMIAYLPIQHLGKKRISAFEELGIKVLDASLSI
jgi:hypothetical protein